MIIWKKIWGPGAVLKAAVQLTPPMIVSPQGLWRSFWSSSTFAGLPSPLRHSNNFEPHMHDRVWMWIIILPKSSFLPLPICSQPGSAVFPHSKGRCGVTPAAIQQKYLACYQAKWIKWNQMSLSNLYTLTQNKRFLPDLKEPRRVVLSRIKMVLSFF